jgi:hypothetical protein
MVTAPRITSFAPQLLVDDLDGAMKFYRDVLGFSFGPPWRGFYAIGERDGFAVHLKCAPKSIEDRANRRQNEHLDVYAGVVGPVRRVQGEGRDHSEAAGADAMGNAGFLY